VDERKVQKYTQGNIHYYINYLLHIGNLPIAHIKFFDESHFDRKTLQGKFGIGPSGERVERLFSGNLSASYSLLLLTRLDSTIPVDIDLVENEPCDRWRFGVYILSCVEREVLQPGDYLILDNARSHVAAEVLQPLHALLSSLGISLLFLPAYSPELNPCELVFSFVKWFIRRHSSTDCLWHEIVRAVAAVDYETVVRFYLHCINIS